MTTRLPGDQVSEWDPVRFAVAFTRAMRRHQAVHHRPSLRSSLAIPRFLFARWARLRTLTPRDYLHAAVLLSPPEDQAIAEAIARALLFPQREEAPDAAITQATTDTDQDASNEEEVAQVDILADIASLDLDLDAIDDLGDLDALLMEDDEEDDALKAFSLFEQLYSSADPTERALGELMALLGGPAEFEASGANTLPLIRVTVEQMLLARVGALEPDHLFYGCQAGFGASLGRAVQHPWSVASVLAGTGDHAGLQAHLHDLLAEGTDRDRGRTLLYLKPHKIDVSTFAQAALAQAGDLTGFAELAVGFGEWVDPPDALLAAAAAENPRRALEAAGWLEMHFGESLHTQIIEHWARRLNTPPTLDRLAEIAVDCGRWHTLADAALPDYRQDLDRAGGGTPQQPVPEALIRACVLAGELHAQTFSKAREIAAAIGTAVMVRVQVEVGFLPTLDALLERGVIPDDIPAVVAQAQNLGIDEEEIYDRIGQALEQMRQMIQANNRDVERYQRLIARINEIPDEMLGKMCADAVADRNLPALAALLAVDLGAASGKIPDGLAAEALGYKGIGGGANLLKQWFSHRNKLSAGLRAQVRAMAKAALMDLAFDWMGKAGGSTESGLIPQNKSRPFRPGDELDALDIEATLDAIVSAGRPLDLISAEDLFVQDTARGRAGFGVLIDISGSMSGRELAICAVAVVMLLGRLRPEEVALAVFESNTHTLKSFNDTTDLDALAEEVLDLRATGGTRADAALRWAGDQFETLYEADVRLLFLLSDFCFFEDQKVIRKHAERFSALGVQLFAASHGFTAEGPLNTLKETMGGQHVQLTNLERLPEILIATIQQFAA